MIHSTYMLSTLLFNVTKRDWLHVDTGMSEMYVRASMCEISV